MQSSTPAIHPHPTKSCSRSVSQRGWGLPPTVKSMDSLDKLLDQLKAEYDQAKPAASQPQKNAAKSFTPQPKSLSLVDSLLAEVGADFAAQDEAEELKKQQELEQEKIRQAQIKAQEIEALQGEAEAWLKTLDPFSPEGFWFESFAESYPSKLEAAIEYLQRDG